MQVTSTNNVNYYQNQDYYNIITRTHNINTKTNNSSITTDRYAFCLPVPKFLIFIWRKRQINYTNKPFVNSFDDTFCTWLSYSSISAAIL